MSKEKNEVSAEEESNSFPSETLSYCIDMVSQVVKKKGDSNVSYKEYAIILGRPVGAVSLPLSTCSQYKIVKNVHGKGYGPTDLFHKIDKPVYKDDKSQGMLTALSNPPLYKKLIEEFNGKVLPDEDGLENHLVKNYSIKTYIVQKVVRVFFKNFRELELIDSNNRLKFILNTVSSGHVEQEQKGRETPAVQEQRLPATPPPNERLFEQAIDLGGVDTAYLKYPRSITLSQTKLLRIHLEATLAGLEERHKANENV